MFISATAFYFTVCYIYLNHCFGFILFYSSRISSDLEVSIFSIVIVIHFISLLLILNKLAFPLLYHIIYSVFKDSQQSISTTFSITTSNLTFRSPNNQHHVSDIAHKPAWWPQQQQQQRSAYIAGCSAGIQQPAANACILIPCRHTVCSYAFHACSTHVTATIG